MGVVVGVGAVGVVSMFAQVTDCNFCNDLTLRVQPVCGCVSVYVCVYMCVCTCYTLQGSGHAGPSGPVVLVWPGVQTCLGGIECTAVDMLSHITPQMGCRCCGHITGGCHCHRRAATAASRLH